MQEIYTAHSRTVYKYLLTLSGSAQTAEELTQETFYQAVKSINKFDGTCKITTWLCAIAKNLFLNHCRKRRWEQLDDISVCTTNSPEDTAIAKVEHIELMRQLHLLENEQREVMYLRVLGDLSFKEIGEILSQSENWARVTYYRGKEKLKKEFYTDEK